jgi:hypothetical protein
MKTRLLSIGSALIVSSLCVLGEGVVQPDVAGLAADATATFSAVKVIAVPIALALILWGLGVKVMKRFTRG